jgi:hypothetical protein
MDVTIAEALGDDNVAQPIPLADRAESRFELICEERGRLGSIGDPPLFAQRGSGESVGRNKSSVRNVALGNELLRAAGGNDGVLQALLRARDEMRSDHQSLVSKPDRNELSAREFADATNASVTAWVQTVAKPRAHHPN